MPHLNCSVMTKFLTQVYEYSSWDKEFVSPALLSSVDASQADSVRSILQRFAVTGIATGRDPSRDSFIGDLREDESIDTEKVNDMLDTPDLSMMDEMEVKDFIADNISFTEKPKDQPDGDVVDPSPGENDQANSE